MDQTTGAKTKVSEVNKTTIIEASFKTKTKDTTNSLKTGDLTKCKVAEVKVDKTTKRFCAAISKEQEIVNMETSAHTLMVNRT